MRAWWNGPGDTFTFDRPNGVKKVNSFSSGGHANLRQPLVSLPEAAGLERQVSSASSSNSSPVHTGGVERQISGPLSDTTRPRTSSNLSDTRGVVIRTKVGKEKTLFRRQASTNSLVVSMKAQKEPFTKRCSAFWRQHVIIDPHTSAWLEVWDRVVFGCLIFAAVTIPYESAFPSSGGFLIPGTIFYCSDFIFLMFFTDMLLQFIIAYPHPDSPACVVKEPCLIAKRYLKRWFIVDFISASPFELYVRLAHLQKSDFWKALRLLRLFRLLRLTHLSRMRRRWNINGGVTNRGLTLAKFAGSAALWCHWMACLWSGVAINNSWGKKTWLMALKESKEDTMGCAEEDRCVYAISLYWAIMTFTSIGYGDITPQNEMEYWISCLCMASMTSVWAFIVGQVCAIMSVMNKQDADFKHNMDTLNWFMEDRHMDNDMRLRLRKYMIETKDMLRLQTQHEVVKQLSPMLQGEISMHLHSHWMDKVWYLNNMRREIVVGISRRLRTLVFAPQEDVYEDRTLCVIRRGIAIRKGRLLVTHDLWGEDMLLHNENLRDPAPARSVGYLEVIMLTYADFEATLHSFPEEQASIQRARIRIATRRGLLKISRAVQDMMWKTDSEELLLSDVQLFAMYKQVLAGTWTGELEEEDPIDQEIEHFLDLAEDELIEGHAGPVKTMCCPKVKAAPSSPTSGNSPSRDKPRSMTFDSSDGRVDTMAMDMSILKECVEQLSLKVDVLLLKDRPHHHHHHHNGHNGGHRRQVSSGGQNDETGSTSAANFSHRRVGSEASHGSHKDDSTNGKKVIFRRNSVSASVPSD